MTSAAHIRVSAGVPEGGRFAPSGRAESDLELTPEYAGPTSGAPGAAAPTKKRKALRRGTIRIAHQVPGGLREYTETEAVLVGGFGVHKAADGRGWVATHAASGMKVTPSFTSSKRIDALRVSTALMTMTDKVPGYWDAERPSGQHQIGQLPTSPERQARYGTTPCPSPEISSSPKTPQTRITRARKGSSRPSRAGAGHPRTDGAFQPKAARWRLFMRYESPLQ